MKTEHSGRGGRAPGLGLGKHRPPGASPGEAAGPRERGGVALLKHEQGAGVPGRSGGQNQGPGCEDRPQAEGAERGGGSHRPHALLTGQRTRQRRPETGVAARGRVPGTSRGEAGGATAAPSVTLQRDLSGGVGAAGVRQGVTWPRRSGCPPARWARTKGTARREPREEDSPTTSAVQSWKSPPREGFEQR